MTTLRITPATYAARTRRPRTRRPRRGRPRRGRPRRRRPRRRRVVKGSQTYPKVVRIEPGGPAIPTLSSPRTSGMGVLSRSFHRGTELRKKLHDLPEKDSADPRRHPPPAGGRRVGRGGAGRGGAGRGLPGHVDRPPAPPAGLTRFGMTSARSRRPAPFEATSGPVGTELRKKLHDFREQDSEVLCQPCRVPRPHGRTNAPTRRTRPPARTARPGGPWRQESVTRPCRWSDRS
jgi:hypothetical protein